jgi:hypothetical protein
MPNAVILDLDSYRRRGTRNSQPDAVRTLALDECEEAYRQCDWKAFDRWFRILAMTRDRCVRPKNKDLNRWPKHS